MKKTSLRDIAEALGVSKTLVSLVLNGKAEEHRISKEIIDKVNALAKEKGYEPNQFAKALRTGKSNTIGLIVADIANPFFSRMARSIEDEANKANYTVIFGSSDEDPAKADKLLKVMLDRQIDGLIVSPTLGGKSNIEFLKKNKIPFVLIDRHFPELKTNYVGVNNFNAAFDAINDLIKRKGSKKIAHITFNKELYHMEQRMKGYEKALADNNIPFNESLIKYLSVDHSKDEIFEIIKSMVTSVDAFFFANNRIGLQAIECIQSLGIAIGQDINIVCFDDLDAFHLLPAEMSVINQPIYEIGTNALNLLLEQIESKDMPTKEIILPVSHYTLNNKMSLV